MSDAMSGNPWHNQYHVERLRLLEALGKTTAGGVVESVQHVGSTSVLGLAGAGRVDVALAVWPFPLEAKPAAALAALGYQALAAEDDAPVQRYHDAGGGFQLLLAEAGGQAWTDLVLVRDYLRHSAQGRQAFVAHRAAEAAAPGATGADRARFFDELLAPAEAWWIGHHAFGPIQAAAGEMAGFGGQWMVAGGWAIELAAGSVARVHHDVDFVAARADQMALQAHLFERGWELSTPLEGRLEPWPRHMRLELPRHQVHAHREDDFLDFLLTDLSGGLWRYRREPGIIRTLDKACRRTEAGLPYLAPELALLFKSKNTSKPHRPRPGDQADFERACPLLDGEQRAWLRWALMATEPGHAWIELLA